ncbi:MAG: aminoacetone oxidase family FAD-binding enzyme [Bacilli bacterium]|nr:aminoacetone oxidase family FAD-binding enzyme [Bacilli bacterium]MDD4733873.1 aminoacetone oxidase family FAD-binding enzyme [Bacilli bacterium]
MYDVIVIGAGPAGVMASIKAGSRNKKVLLIEKNEKILKKLELTGGGRCNLTNFKPLKVFIEQLPVNSKNLYSTLTSFGPKEIMDYFNKLGVKLKIENEDRVFPVSNSSFSIIEALISELKKYKVELKLNENVKDLVLDEKIKIVKTNQDIYKTKNIIIATGGFSYPQTGSNGDGYRLAKKIKQDVTDVYPAETFLITKQNHNLNGITIEDVDIYLDKEKVSGSLLFTHTGLSGPAIFKISEKVYKKLKEEVVIINVDFKPKINIEKLLDDLNNYDSKKEVLTFIKSLLPKRLAYYLISDFNKVKIGQLSKQQKQKIVFKIKKYPLEIIKTGSLEQSLITGGGVDMKKINSKTMESIQNKGVYFIGEVLDIHGHTGGYNITLALSTGYTAGNSI